MASEKVETIVAGNYIEMERGSGEDHGQPAEPAAASGASGGKKLALSVSMM